MAISSLQVKSLQQQVRLGYLDAKDSFKVSDAALIAANCNGCGAANAKLDFVPDTIYGLDISAACHIHDWDYFDGLTIEDKASADRRVLNNIYRIIKRDKSWRRCIRFLMRRRAKKYYHAVHYFGGAAFWDGK